MLPRSHQGWFSLGRRVSQLQVPSRAWPTTDGTSALARGGGRHLIDDHEVTQATTEDIDDILALQERNQPERGGALSARLPREWLEATVADMPVVVARRDGRVVGYLISASREAYAGVPVVAATLRAHPGAAPDAYVYGAVCVAGEARGLGLAAAMFAALRARLPGREAALFIRRDKAASLRAHERMGMREVARFAHGGTEMAVLAYVG